MVFNSKSLREIADYDDTIMQFVINRERDESGRLVRKTGLPWWVKFDSRGMRVHISKPRSFSTMFKEVKASQGLDENEINNVWYSYLRDNPKLAEIIATRKAQQEMMKELRERSRSTTRS